MYKTYKVTPGANHEANMPLQRLNVQTLMPDMNTYVYHELVKRHLAFSVEETIMPERFYQRCFQSSNLAILSWIVAFYLKLYVLGTLNLGVWLTSVNYWRKPTIGFRRTLDICVVHVAFWVHIYHSIYATALNSIYYVVVVAGLACYRNARRYHFQGNYEYDSRWHCTMHVIGNISNMILYCGCS
eukprot:CFRG8656